MKSLEKLKEKEIQNLRVIIGGEGNDTDKGDTLSGGDREFY